MLIAMFTHILVSLLAHFLFTKRIIDISFDVFGSFKVNHMDEVVPRNTRHMRGSEANGNGITLDPISIPRPSVNDSYTNKGYH